MKKIFTIFFVLVAIFAVSTLRGHVASAISVEPVAENNPTVCTDGIDNDDDGATDGADGDCVAPLTTPTPVFTPENTVAACTDGIDNDDDGTTDGADGDCVAVLTPVSTPEFTPENTVAKCTDGIDNDDDGATDGADGDCVAVLATPATPAPETTTPPANTGVGVASGGGGLTGGFGGGSSSLIIPNTTGSNNIVGTVLGASTDDPAVCSDMLKTYMKKGKKNNKVEVMKLQAFLNIEMKSGLTVSGIFDDKTEAAVKAFQTKYASEILTPWVSAGKMPSGKATGYVYKTTLRQINILRCASLKSPITIPQIPASELN